MADATLAATRTGRAVAISREAVVAAGAFSATTALAAADGGYFPTAWGWGALIALWVTAAALVAAPRIEIGALGGVFLAGIGALTAWVWLSGVWSVDPVRSIVEGQRMLFYLGAAAALLLVVRRRSARALLGGTLAAVVVVSAYGLATRLFPDRLGVFDPIAEYRLSEPVGYWNGLGIFAAMGVLLALGFALDGRRLLTRAAAAAALAVLLPTVYFTFGRGPWIALGAGLVAALLAEPRRLRLLAGALVLAPAGALAVLLASRVDSLRRVDTPLADAARDGHRLALALAAVAVLAAAAALAFAVLERRISAPRPVRLAFVAAVALVAVATLVAVFARVGGPVALTRDAYDAFTEPPPRTDVDVGRRLFSFSGSYRADLWASAWRDYEDHPLLGSGAGTYEQHWLRDRPFVHKVVDAHSLYLETLAELGPVGLVLLGAVLVAPLVAALRARREPLLALAVGAYAAYLAHAGVDWDWELTGVTLVALACAASLLATGRRADDPRTLSLPLRAGAVAAAVAVGIVAFVGLVGNSAVAASEEAADEERWAKAEHEARKGERWAPWSAEPWQRLGEAHLGQGETASARAAFRRAVEKEPRDWELWVALAETSSGAERRRALARATELNPLDPEIQDLRR